MNDAQKFAAELNSHLESGGAVQVSTYQKSWLYESRHAGWFSANDKNQLFVRAGKGKNFLGTLPVLLVKIRAGRFEAKGK